MSDTNEFFDVLLENLKEIAPEKEEMFRKLLIKIRQDWQGAQLYISQQPITLSEFEQIRKDYEAFLSKHSQEHGISRRLLHTKLYSSGCTPTKSLYQPFPEQQLDLTN